MVSPTGWDDEKRTCFISSTAWRWPKLKKKDGRKPFREWFSFLPTKNNIPLLVCSVPLTPSLQHAFQMFSQNQDQTLPAEHTASELCLKPRDLLPSKLSCQSTISTLHLTSPAHGRHQLSYQVQQNSTSWSKAKSANWIPGLATLSVGSLFICPRDHHY